MLVLGRHLLVALEVELVRVEGHLRLGERALGLHAEQRSVRVVVLAPEVVHVGGSDDRPAELLGHRGDLRVRVVLIVDLVFLDLEVDVFGAEHLDQLVGVFAGGGGIVLVDPAHETRGKAAGERDDALVVLLEELHVHVGLAAMETLEETR